VKFIVASETKMFRVLERYLLRVVAIIVLACRPLRSAIAARKLAHATALPMRRCDARCGRSPVVTRITASPTNYEENLKCRGRDPGRRIENRLAGARGRDCSLDNASGPDSCLPGTEWTSVMAELD